jgi:hypothetical protein
MGATAQGFANHETRPIAAAMRDASAAAADHTAKLRRPWRAIFSFFSNAAIAMARWLHDHCHFRLRRR